MGSTISPEDQFVKRLNGFAKCRAYAYSTSQHVNCICKFLMDFYKNPTIKLTDKGYNAVVSCASKVNLYYGYRNAYEAWYKTLLPIPAIIARTLSSVDSCNYFNRTELSEDVVNNVILKNDHNICKVLLFYFKLIINYKLYYITLLHDFIIQSPVPFSSHPTKPI